MPPREKDLWRVRPRRGVLAIDGVTPLDPSFWQWTGGSRRGYAHDRDPVARVLGHSCSPTTSSRAPNPDHRLFDRVAKVAVVRRNGYVPVWLTPGVEADSTAGKEREELLVGCTRRARWPGERVDAVAVRASSAGQPTG